MLFVPILYSQAMKADEPRQNRIPFMMSDAELAAVDEWRFKRKIATRAEAIRRLCELGRLHDENFGITMVLALVIAKRARAVAASRSDEAIAELQRDVSLLNSILSAVGLRSTGLIRNWPEVLPDGAPRTVSVEEVLEKYSQDRWNESWANGGWRKLTDDMLEEDK